jgi:hypothetical protein
VSRARRCISLVLALSACGDSPANSDATSTAPTGVASETTSPTDTGETTPTSDDTTGPTSPTDPTDGMAVDDAFVVTSQLPTALACGEVFAAAVTMRNTGTSTWTHDDFKLGTVDDSDPLFPNDTRVWLDVGESVAPGGEHTFAFDLTAPATPGVYLTDWRMVHETVQWFGALAAANVTVDCDVDIPDGVPHLEGRALVDDDGPFLALGTTMMWAAWGYKNDRPRLEANLQYLADHDFDFIRALGTVGDPNGEDYWDGREIDPHWPDYADVIAGLTDLAFDKYGLRMEWTLIGDGQYSVPTFEDRQALVQTFLAMAVGREHKILHFEIANESWQNGFDGDQGLADLRALAQTMKDQSPNLVAASAPPSADCPQALAIYDGGIADLATIHYDRDISQIEGPWRPVRQPWEHQFCAGLPVGSNNEPIGPGSSVAEELDPVRLVAGAITTYVSGLPIYVFHTRAGIRGDDDLWNMAGIADFVHVHDLLPPDLPAWDQKNAQWPDAPFTVFAGENGQLVPDMMWVDLGNPESGAVRAYAAVRDPEFVVFPIGILGSVTVAPRRPMTFDVIDPRTGATLASHDLATDQQVQISGADALLLRGTYK